MLVGVAHAAPGLPTPLRDVVERMGVPPRAVDMVMARAFPRWSSRNDGDTPDANAAALMERARREDVIVPPDDRLFDEKNVQLGAWDPAAFARSYGTALFLTEPYDAGRTPVFLVHGISGSPRDFADLVARFRRSAYQPVLFFYPTGMSLADVSHELGTRVQDFVKRHPTTGFAVVAHSMGGLVAKGMLDRFDAAKTLPGWKAFVAISTPWAGMPIAAYGARLSGHPPCWDDLVPTSRFMRNVTTTRMPDRIGFYMFFGARSSRSILTAIGNNDGRLSVDAMMDTPVAEQARDVFGFYEDHESILRAPRVLDRLTTVLERELPRR